MLLILCYVSGMRNIWETEVQRLLLKLGYQNNFKPIKWPPQITFKQYQLYVFQVDILRQSSEIKALLFSWKSNSPEIVQRCLQLTTIVVDIVKIVMEIQNHVSNQFTDETFFELRLVLFEITVYRSSQNQSLPVDDSSKNQSLAVNDSSKNQSLAVDDSSKNRSLAVDDSSRNQSMAIDDSSKNQSMAVDDSSRNQGLAVDDSSRNQSLPVDDSSRNQSMAVDDSSRNQSMVIDDSSRNKTQSVNSSSENQRQTIEEEVFKIIENELNNSIKFTSEIEKKLTKLLKDVKGFQFPQISCRTKLPEIVGFSEGHWFKRFDDVYYKF